MKRAIVFTAILTLVLLLPAKSHSKTLDFRPYKHGEVRKNSFTFSA